MESVCQPQTRTWALSCPQVDPFPSLQTLTPPAAVVSAGPWRWSAAEPDGVRDPPQKH